MPLVNPELAARVGLEASGLIERSNRWIVWTRTGMWIGGVLVFLVFLAIPPIRIFIVLAMIAWFVVSTTMLIVGVARSRALQFEAERRAGEFVSRASGATIATVPRGLMASPMLMPRPIALLDSWLLANHAWPSEVPPDSSMTGVVPRIASTLYRTNFTGVIVGSSIAGVGIIGLLVGAVLVAVFATTRTPASFLALLDPLCVLCIAVGVGVSYGSTMRQARARIAWNTQHRD